MGDCRIVYTIRDNVLAIVVVTVGHRRGDAVDEIRRTPSQTSSRFSRWKPALMERVTRIELALSAWEADVLPLNYTRGGSQYASPHTTAVPKPRPQGVVWNPDRSRAVV